MIVESPRLSVGLRLPNLFPGRSLGTIVVTNQRVEKAINPSVEQLSQWVKTTQPAIHVDETPWPVKGVKEWLWVFTNQLFCLFRAADTRGRAELEAQLGSEYRGVLSSDV